MRRLFLFLCSLSIVSLILGCMHSNYNSPPPKLTGPQLATQTTAQAVALVSPLSGKNALCSATWVSQDTILTAHHCVEGYAEMLHRFQIFQAMVAAGVPKIVAYIASAMDPEEVGDLPDMVKQALQQANRMFPMPKLDSLTMSYSVASEIVDLNVKPLLQHHATVLALYPNYDLALLRASADYPAHAFASLAPAAPQIGDDLYFVGQAEANWFTFRRTMVVAYRKDMTAAGVDTIKGPFMQLQGDVHPGDSGSGNYNQYGQLVSVNSFMQKESGFAFAIALVNVRAVLQGQHLVPVKLDPQMAVDPKLD